MKLEGVKVRVEFGDVEDMDFEETLEEVMEAKERLDGVHEIIFLQDYIDLLEEIAEVTDGQFRIYNCGTDIVCWED